MTSETVLWDVVEEHLDDAAFLWEQWSRALGSALTASEVEHVEGRLLASVDALAIAAPDAGARVLEPAMQEGDPGAIAAAALALLDSPAGFLPVRRALANDDAAVRRSALQRALALSSRRGLEREVEPLLGPEHPAGAQAALGVFASRRLDPGSRLLDLLRSSDAGVAVAALRAAPWTAQPARALVERAYGSPAAPVRDAAIEAGLLLGFRSALDASRDLVAARAPSPAALLALAMSGKPSELDLLHAALEEPPLRRAALRALGLAGCPRSVERILPWLAEPATARAAGEAFEAITGIALAGELAANGDEEEVLAAGEVGSDLVPGRDEDLPRPDPDAVAARWATEQGRFDAGARYLAGIRFSGEALRAALRSAPMRRRPALALELAVRTGRTLTVDCRAFVRDQLRAERQHALPLRTGAAAPLERLLRS